MSLAEAIEKCLKNGVKVTFDAPAENKIRIAIEKGKYGSYVTMDALAMKAGTFEWAAGEGVELMYDHLIPVLNDLSSKGVQA